MVIKPVNQREYGKTSNHSEILIYLFIYFYLFVCLFNFKKYDCELGWKIPRHVVQQSNLENLFKLKMLYYQT